MCGSACLPRARETNSRTAGEVSWLPIASLITTCLFGTNLLTCVVSTTAAGAGFALLCPKHNARVILQGGKDNGVLFVRALGAAKDSVRLPGTARNEQIYSSDD